MERIWKSRLAALNVPKNANAFGQYFTNSDYLKHRVSKNLVV
jgi:hypothetical protein